MNTVLWIAQVLWGVFFSLNGFGKICCYNQALWNQSQGDVAWFSAVPQDLFIFIGVCEFLGGIGLILPAMTGIKPKLTPLAGAGLAAVMLLAALFHMARDEYHFVPINLALAWVAAFIAHGRWVAKPIAPASSNAVRVLTGIAVLFALVLVDIAPVRYKMTLIREASAGRGASLNIYGGHIR